MDGQKDSAVFIKANSFTSAVNCVIGQWAAFGECSTSCGDGQRTRTRGVLVPAAYGGAACPATVESQPCNLGPCGAPPPPPQLQHT